MSGWLPPHAYIPGETPRHPEDLFEPIKQSVHRDLAADQLFETEAWSVGLQCFRNGYFWEAHELWEPVWLAFPPNAGERIWVQSAIQLANAGVKARMGRDSAKARLLQHAKELHVEAQLRGASGPSEVKWQQLLQQICAL